MSGCLATTRAGDPCQFRLAPGSDYCLNHRPGADTSAAARRAARAGAIARNPSVGLHALMVAFHNREVIQATLDGIVRLLLAGRLEESKAALLIRACQVAARNFDRTPDLLSGPKPQSHDAPRYFLRLQSLLETVDPVLADALAIELAAAQPPPE